MTGMPSRWASRTAMISRRGVHDVYGRRQPSHVLHAREVLLELEPFAIEQQAFLLRIELKGVLLLATLKFFQAPDLLAYGLEVREHTAQPALGNEERSAALSVLLDDRAKLSLGANEEHPLAAKNHPPDNALRGLEAVQGLAQIDDVDAVFFREDELAHLRIPTASLVPEMDTRF